MKTYLVAGAAVAALLAFGGAAQAACVVKGAKATSGTEASAKWFAVETMVQDVSWGLWPTWVATGEVPGYTIKNQKWKCTPDPFGVACLGQASFCKK